MSPLDRLTAWLHWRDATALTAPIPTPLPEPEPRGWWRVSWQTSVPGVPQAADCATEAEANAVRDALVAAGRVAVVWAVVEA